MHQREGFGTALVNEVLNRMPEPMWPRIAQPRTVQGETSGGARVSPYRRDRSYKMGEDAERAALLITLLLGASGRLAYIPGRRGVFYRCSQSI